MRDKEVNKLIQAAEKQVEHLLIIKPPYGTVKLNGTANLILTTFQNQDLFNHVQTVARNCTGPVLPQPSHPILSSPVLLCHQNG